MGHRYLGRRAAARFSPQDPPQPRRAAPGRPVATRFRSAPRATDLMPPRSRGTRLGGTRVRTSARELAVRMSFGTVPSVARLTGLAVVAGGLLLAGLAGPAAANEQPFDTWLDGVRQEAKGRGVSRPDPRRLADRHQADPPDHRARPQPARVQAEGRRVSRPGGHRRPHPVRPHPAGPPPRPARRRLQTVRRAEAVHRRPVGHRDRFRPDHRRFRRGHRAGDAGL